MIKITPNNQIDRILNRVGQELETETERVIWEQIKMIITAEGRFDSKEWIIQQKPLEIRRIGNKATISREVKLEPSPFKDYKPLKAAQQLQLFPEEEIKINDLAIVTEIVNNANGFTMEHEKFECPFFIPNKIALIHSEASELLEEYRKGGKTLETYEVGDNKPMEYELADIIIRCLQFTKALNIPIGTRIAEKLEVNAKRGWKHGNKTV